MSNRPDGQSFGANADDALTEKIIRHTAASLHRQNGQAAPRPTSPPPPPAHRPPWALRGLPAILLLGLLAGFAVAIVLKRFRR